MFDLATIASHEDVRWAGTRDEPLTTSPLEALAAPTAAPCWAEIRSRLSSSFFRPGVHWVLAKAFCRESIPRWRKKVYDQCPKDLA